MIALFLRPNSRANRDRVHEAAPCDTVAPAFSVSSKALEFWMDGIGYYDIVISIFARKCCRSSPRPCPQEIDTNEHSRSPGRPWIGHPKSRRVRSPHVRRHADSKGAKTSAASQPPLVRSRTSRGSACDRRRHQGLQERRLGIGTGSASPDSRETTLIVQRVSARDETKQQDQCY